VCGNVNRHERRKLEVREKILATAFDLFLAQGAAATTIEEICERADVANRTFFNHFATRQDMIRALAERRLVNLPDVFFDRGDEAIPARLIGVFEVSTRHDVETLADIIVGALSGGIVNRTVDRTYSLETNLHSLGIALAELLTA
jgi:AcrR family transcriptional regulator